MRAASVALLVVVGACGGTDNPPSLAITPSGSGGAPLAVSSATSFKATLLNSDEPVAWTLTGSGSLSTTTGLDTVFVPPLGSNTETLTASAGDLTASVQITSGPMVLTAETIPSLGAPVTVQYDPQQIPHIQCAEAADCLAVQGYLQIRDRTFPMDFLRRVATSRVAELIGVDGLSQDEQLRTLFITRNGHKVQDDLAAAMDPATKALLDAYVSGINAYIMQLRTSQGDTPLGNEYRQLPYPLTANDIPLWTEQDTWAVARFEQFSLSDTSGEEAGYGKAFAAWGPGATTPQLDKVAAWIRSAAPPSEQAHTLAETPFTPSFVTGPAHAPVTTSFGKWSGVIAKAYDAAQRLAAFIRPLGAAIGSNNWAVMAAKSATGKAMVANDPHLPLQYPPLFWLSTMTSADPADNLDLSGGSFPGVPGALVGRGKNVGWGVTVTGYDVTDLYLESLSACASSSGYCVSFGGSAVGINAVPETYNVRVASGSGSDAFQTYSLAAADPQFQTLPDGNPPVVLVVPHHGPITSIDPGNGTAVSLRWTGQEGNTQDLKGVWGLNTAKDVDSAMASLAYFATGAQNWMLADDAGNIAYDPHALVPVRLWATSTNSAFVPWMPLPGDGTAEWGDGVSDCANGSGVPASCWVPDADLPQGKNPDKGYYFTANADPTADGVSDSGEPRPAVTGSGSDPYYLSFDWDDSTGFRATRIDQMLQAAIAANGTVSLDDMEAIQQDHYMRYGSAFVSYLAANIGSDDLAADSTLALAYTTLVTTWPAVGFDCPSGLLGDDQNNSPVDTTPSVQQASGACFLFHAFVRHLLTNVFADDIGPLGFSIDGNMVQAVKAMLYMLSGDAVGTTFCDDRGGQTHTCKEQVITALDEAVQQISGSFGADPTAWTWGRVHFIQPTPLVALVTTGFEPGPYARPGGAFTVDVGTPSGETSYGLTFQYTSGGNVRHISVMDPTTPVTKMQLPGPERDGPTGLLVSGGPPDLLSQWVMNQYFDFAIGAQIGDVATSTQTFSAQ